MIDEIGVNMTGLYVEVHAPSRLMAWLDECSHVANVAACGFVDVSIEVDGSFILSSEATSHVELSEQSVVECELVDAQVGINGNVRVEVMGFDLSCGESCKFNVVEVDETKHILQVDAMKVGIERVGSIVRYTAIDSQIAAKL